MVTWRAGVALAFSSANDNRPCSGADGGAKGSSSPIGMCNCEPGIERAPIPDNKQVKGAIHGVPAERQVDSES